MNVNHKEDKKTTGAVCLSPRKHNIFADYSEKKSPIKSKKFNVDNSSNTNDMLMGDTIVVEHYPELDISRSEIQSSTTLSSVKSVRIGQHVTVKAKVTNMSKEEKAGDLTLTCELYAAWTFSFNQNGIAGEFYEPSWKQPDIHVP